MLSLRFLIRSVAFAGTASNNPLNYSRQDIRLLVDILNIFISILVFQIRLFENISDAKTMRRRPFVKFQSNS
jgi:hypothetical protein